MNYKYTTLGWMMIYHQSFVKMGMIFLYYKLNTTQITKWLRKFKLCIPRHKIFILVQGFFTFIKRNTRHKVQYIITLFSSADTYIKINCIFTIRIYMYMFLITTRLEPCLFYQMMHFSPFKISIVLKFKEEEHFSWMFYFKDSRGHTKFSYKMTARMTLMK